MKHTQIVFTSKVESEVLVSFEVKTTGYCGGDAGHGGKTSILVKTDCGDLGIAKKDNGILHKEWTIEANGDAELDALISMLRESLRFLESVTSREIAITGGDPL